MTRRTREQGRVVMEHMGGWGRECHAFLCPWGQGLNDSCLQALQPVDYQASSPGWCGVGALERLRGSLPWDDPPKAASPLLPQGRSREDPGGAEHKLRGQSLWENKDLH